MIKAILVDDERPALRELAFLLEEYPDIFVAGAYTSPLAAIDKIADEKPQAVFLDINMPQLRGIDLASRILDASPQTQVVFVTAFDEYAVDAFELHALDYILKPVSPKRLRKTVLRMLEAASAAEPPGGETLHIRCMGGFRMAWEDKEPVKWRAEKTKELFAYLLQNRGRGVSKEELLDRLWPEDDPEKAVRQLYNGVYYIRKALREYGAGGHVAIDADYRLALKRVFCDAARIQELEREAVGSLQDLEEMESLFSGPYLEGEYYPWAEAERARLTALHQNCLIALSKRYIQNALYGRASEKLHKAYAQDPYDEAVTELLMELYMRTGEKSRAAAHFHAYSRLVGAELGIEPSDRICALYRSIR